MLRTAIAHGTKKQLREGPAAATPDDEQFGVLCLREEDFCCFTPDDLGSHCGSLIVWDRGPNQFCKFAFGLSHELLLERYVHLDIQGSGALREGPGRDYFKRGICKGAVAHSPIQRAQRSR